MNYIYELYVTCDMYVESCTILVVCGSFIETHVVLDGLPSLYGLKYDSVTACELPLYLCSYKLVGSVIVWVYRERWSREQASATPSIHVTFLDHYGINRL